MGQVHCGICELGQLSTRDLYTLGHLQLSEDRARIPYLYGADISKN